MDLLHGTGDNQQLAGAAGSYGPTPFPQTPTSTPRHQPQPSAAPASAASYVSAAESERPKSPVPAPPPAPEPRKAPEPKLSAPSAPRPKRGGPILIGLLVVLIVGGIAGGIWWWLSHRSSTPVATKPNTTTAGTPSVPTDLNQLDSSSTTLSQGVTTKKTQLIFQFSNSTATSGSLTPEVELEPVGTSFTNQPTITGKALTLNGGTSQFSVDSATLKDGAYHWQARLSSAGHSSAWTVFGSDASATAFTIDTTAPGVPTVSSIGGVPVANPTTVTSNRPAIVGKTDPSATVSVSITPDSQSFSATADAEGNWTITPTADIPNGQHQLSIIATDAAGNASAAASIALTINPATAADTTPVSGASGSAASSTSTTAPSKHLASTGDNTTLISSISLAVLVMAVAGIAWVRRRYVAF